MTPIKCTKCGKRRDADPDRFTTCRVCSKPICHGCAFTHRLQCRRRRALDRMMGERHTMGKATRTRTTARKETATQRRHQPKMPVKRGEE